MTYVTIFMMPLSLFLLEDPSFHGIIFYILKEEVNCYFLLTEMQSDCHITVFGIAVKLRLKWCREKEMVKNDAREVGRKGLKN